MENQLNRKGVTLTLHKSRTKPKPILWGKLPRSERDTTNPICTYGKRSQVVALEELSRGQVASQLNCDVFKSHSC